MVASTISTENADKLNNKIKSTGSPIKRILEQLTNALKQDEKTGSHESHEKLHDVLALGDQADAASTGMKNYNALLTKIIERYKQQEADGFGEKYTEYNQLNNKAENFMRDLIGEDQELRAYLDNYGLSNEDYVALTKFEQLLEKNVDDKQTLNTIQNQQNTSQAKISKLTNANRLSLEIKEKINAEKVSAKKKLEDIQATLLAANKKTKLSEKLKEFGAGRKSKLEEDERKQKKYMVALSTAESFAIGHTLEETVAKYKLTENDPEFAELSTFMLRLVEEVKLNEGKKETDLKQEQITFDDLGTQITQLKTQIATDTNTIQDNMTQYEEISEEVEANHEKYLEKIVDLIGEKVSSGDADMIDLLTELAEMESAIKLDIQKEGFDGQGVKNNVDGLYTKLTSFANEFVFPKLKKGQKKKDPSWSVTAGKSIWLRRGVSWSTSGVSGIMGGLGLMHMIPGWASNPDKFPLGHKIGEWVKEFYTTTNGDIDKSYVYMTGGLTLLAIFAALEKFKRHMDHSVIKVGSENIHTKSPIKSFFKNFTGKGTKMVLAVGISATLLAGWTDMSGVASGLFGGQKRKAEKEKISQATQDLTKAYQDAIHYIEFTDSTAGAAQQQALDQENNGGAASGMAGKGPVFISKAVLKSGDGVEILGLNPGDILAGKDILKRAHGQEGQYDSIHIKLQSAIQTLKDAMVVHTTAGNDVDWDQIGKEADKFTGGIDPTKSMQLKDFANKIDLSTQHAIGLMDTVAGKYNGDLAGLKQVYDNIESIVQSGKKLDISLIDTVAFHKKIKDIEIASKKASAAIKSIEPYMSYGHVTDHLRNSGYNQLQMILVELSIFLLIALLHSIYPVRSLISLKRNKKDQQAELDIDFDNISAQVDALTKQITTITPALITNETFPAVQSIYTDASIGEDADFQELVAKIMADDELNRKEESDSANLSKEITKDLVAYTKANLDSIIATHKAAIDTEMAASGLVLADADQDPVTYTDFYATLKDHSTWSPMQFIAAFVKGSKTFRDQVLEGYNTQNSAGK